MSDWEVEKSQPDRAARMPHPRSKTLVVQAKPEGDAMGKRARKKKDRRKNKANHGKRPGA